MAGYHIRTASGIVPVKDWYIKIMGPASSSISHSMTAATAGGGSKGYENGNGAIGQPAYGSLSPLADGTFEIRGLTWAQGAANEPTIVYMGPSGGASSPVPADDDTTWSRIDITGTFFDGAGTRTLVRANHDFTGSGANGTRQWQFRGVKAAQFISGNSYTAVMQRSAGAAPIIAQVKEAYIRTASGIQKYWPAPFVPVTRTFDGPLTSQTETVPAGATNVVIKLWGAGGGGGLFTGPPGGGGGGGGYAERTLAVTGGQTFTYSVGGGGNGLQGPGNGSGAGGGNSNVISASPSFTMACNGAQGGQQAAGGNGGTVSNTGGSVSTTGGNGSSSVAGGSSPNGGANQGTQGANGNAPGGGGAGNINSGSAKGGNGAPARVQFIYT
jgi:hypothetical protein